MSSRDRIAELMMMQPQQRLATGEMPMVSNMDPMVAGRGAGQAYAGMQRLPLDPMEEVQLEALTGKANAAAMHREMQPSWRDEMDAIMGRQPGAPVTDADVAAALRRAGPGYPEDVVGYITPPTWTANPNMFRGTERAPSAADLDQPEVPMPTREFTGVIPDQDI